MHRRLTLSVAMLLVGAGLLAASAVAGPSSSAGPQASDAGKARVGGTLKHSLTVDIDYVDPALWYYVPSWTIAYSTSAMLLNYPHAPAPRGSRLTPEVAQGFPRISRNGLVYTFKLKNTYRLSNGQRVNAQSFARALNRALNRRMSSPAQPFIEDIVGAQAVIAGRAQRASGIVASGNTLTLRMTKRSPDLLARLAMPFFAAQGNLPINPEGVRAPIQSAGPYYIKEWTQNRRVILERNRFYRGPVRGNVNRIEIDIGLPLETIKLNIDRGSTGSACRAGSPLRRQEAVAGPLLREPRTDDPLPGDEPRSPAVRRRRERQRAAEEGRELRGRPAGRPRTGRGVRRRHERPVHAADDARLPEPRHLPAAPEPEPGS